MNLQELGQVQFDARISVTAQELFHLCADRQDLVLETARVLPKDPGPSYEEIVAAVLRRCPEAVIVPRESVVRRWAMDRRWEVGREEFDANYPNAISAHWFDHKAETTWRARASVLESIVHCLTQHPNCVFYEHGLDVAGQPFKACRYGLLSSQYFNAFEY